MIVFRRGTIHSTKWNFTFSFGQTHFHKGFEVRMIIGHRGKYLMVTTKKIYEAFRKKDEEAVKRLEERLAHEKAGTTT